ncbi:flagellar basal body-associated protein FliL [Erythrobacter sp. MTPC3]|uniref:flagellar basal body-associated FliL family protein n=1 Tax=Erythrobacter sp. MTPC3 TaxID=3056564 RepID=UPI0036F44DBB
MAKSKPEETEDAKPKGGKVKILIAAVVLLGLGSGGTYGAFAAGLIGSAEEKADPDLPKLVAKGEDDPYAPPSDDKGSGAGIVHGEGGSDYRTLYYNFEQSFTSNLKDSSGLIQLSLAASTRHDGRVIQWLEAHELAVRSAILVVLASTPEDDVYTVEGKKRLKDNLAKAINEVLTEQEGFGGVDAVHFQTFLIQ